MARVRTQVSVEGFTAAEVLDALDDVREELAQRPWLQPADASWDEERKRLVLIAERPGDDPSPDGPTAGGTLDELRDVVIACVAFSGEGIHFDIDSSVLVEA